MTFKKFTQVESYRPVKISVEELRAIAAAKEQLKLLGKLPQDQ